MNSHPYAPAYQNMAASFAPSHRNQTAFDPGAFAVAAAAVAAGDNKRPRTQGSDNKDGDSDDDDDDDDEGDSDDDGNSSKIQAAASKPNRKIVKGPDGKPKVKLTRGSRACIA